MEPIIIESSIPFEEILLSQEHKRLKEADILKEVFENGRTIDLKATFNFPIYMPTPQGWMLDPVVIS